MSNPDFPDRGPLVFVMTTVNLSLATLFVAARMLSRVGILRRTGWDDYLMVLAWLIALFLSLSIMFGAKRGLGRHHEDIDPEDRAALRMSEYVFSILYNPALMANKTSILIFYLRLSKTKKSLRIESWIILCIVNVAGTILTFINIFQCEPTHAAWDIMVQPDSCIPLLIEFICSAPVNITTDLAILAIPIPVLTSMQLPRRQKTILVITFALGVFVTIVGVVRIYHLQLAISNAPLSASADLQAMFGQIVDFSWNASLALMWSATEVNVGIICACIPTLRPLIIRILPGMLGDPHNGSTVGNALMSNATGAIPLASGSTNPPSWPPPALSTTPPFPRTTSPRPSTDVSIRDLVSPTTHHPRSSLPLPPPPPPPRRPPSSAPSRPTTAPRFITLAPNAKSLLHLTPAESLLACALATILFFLWGFSYGLLNTLNDAAGAVAGLSRAQTLSLTSVYFGAGYLCGPALLGGRLLTRDAAGRSGWGRWFWEGRWCCCSFGRRKGGGGVGKGGGTRKKSDGGEGLEVEKVAVEVDVQGRAVGGFKATFIAGLLIYGMGTITFWPGAVLAAYGGFVVSNFVVGFGLSVVETAANPFLVLCGPPGGYADARLLLAQGVQGVGSVLSGLLANKVFFGRLEEATAAALVDVQWTYLAVTLLSVLLALVFYYVPLPEVEDGELADMASRLTVDPKQSWVGGVTLRTWALGLAVSAQWCYISAQENMSVFFQQLVTAFVPDPSSGHTLELGYRPKGLALSLSDYRLVARSVFAFSRFLASGLCYLSARFRLSPLLPTPRTLLLAAVFSSTMCVLIAVVLPTATNPNLAAIPIILFFFFEGPIWPLVFSLGLRGQGERTKSAAALITMAGCGPAFWPFVSYGILKAGGSVQVAMVVVVVVIATTGVYPLFLTAVKRARAMVDTPPKESVVDDRNLDERSRESEVAEERGRDRNVRDSDMAGGRMERDEDILGQQLTPDQ